MGISKAELKAILGITIFGIVWMTVVNNYLISWFWFKGLTPPYQFILFNLGYVFLSIAIFGSLFNLMRRKEGTINLIINGLCGYLLYSFVFDLWSPPHAWSMTGTGLQDVSGNGSAYISTSSDFIVGWLWEKAGFTSAALPISFVHISSIYLLTYVLTPVLVVIAVALVLEPRGTTNFVRGGFGNNDYVDQTNRRFE